MVSGLVTSPELQLRICSGLARLTRRPDSVSSEIIYFLSSSLRVLHGLSDDLIGCRPRCFDFRIPVFAQEFFEGFQQCLTNHWIELWLDAVAMVTLSELLYKRSNIISTDHTCNNNSQCRYQGTFLAIHVCIGK